MKDAEKKLNDSANFCTGCGAQIKREAIENPQLTQQFAPINTQGQYGQMNVGPSPQQIIYVVQPSQEEYDKDPQAGGHKFVGVLAVFLSVFQVINLFFLKLFTVTDPFFGHGFISFSLAQANHYGYGIKDIKDQKNSIGIC